MFLPRKTTRYLAAINPSLPDPRLIGTCSSWSRIQKDTLQPVGGGMPSLTRTETLLMKLSMELAFPVMRLPRIATMSSPVTHLNTECHRMPRTIKQNQYRTPELQMGREPRYQIRDLEKMEARPLREQPTKGKRALLQFGARSSRTLLDL